MAYFLIQTQQQPGDTPAAQQTSVTPPTLVVAAALHSGPHGSTFGSLNFLGGWLSIAPKFVPPILLVGPLDSHQTCPIFCVKLSSNSLFVGLFA